MSERVEETVKYKSKSLEHMVKAPEQSSPMLGQGAGFFYMHWEPRGGAE